MGRGHRDTISREHPPSHLTCIVRGCGAGNRGSDGSRELADRVDVGPLKPILAEDFGAFNPVQVTIVLEIHGGAGLEFEERDGCSDRNRQGFDRIQVFPGIAEIVQHGR